VEGSRDRRPASQFRIGQALAGALASGLLAAWLGWPVGAAAATELEARRVHPIGVLSPRPKPQTLAAWQPLAAELERALPDRRFTIEALDYQELDAAIAAHRLDLVITNPAHYIAIRQRHPLSGVLATVIEQGIGHSLPAFGGVIFARRDRPDLAGLADLAQARVAAVGTSSLGGYQAQAFELVSAGLEAPAADRLLVTGMPHDRTVEAVLARQADVGFARSGTLEQMAAEGRLDPRELKVLNRLALAGFPDAVSTRLYPEWPVVALSQVDDATLRRIAAALLGLEHPAERSSVGGYHGFTIPADYSSVEATLRALRLPPFEAAPAFDLRDVLGRYRTPAAVLGLAIVVVVLLSVFLAAFSRRLHRARQEALHAGEELRQALAVNEATLAELREAHSRVKQLSGLIPICMYCHKIHSDHGYWDRLEVYLSSHSEALFSHGICPTCMETKYPDQE
jgi:ABC-type phosphate/phosphonate transport system substrate-binding protein